MTDLHEAFRSLTDDEPGESRIDPDAAVRASRARSRTRLQRWLAGGVAAALVVGVGAVVVGPRLAPGSAPSIGSATADPVAGDSSDAGRLKLLDRVVAWLQADTTLGKAGFSTERRVVADDSRSYSFAVGDPAVPSGVSAADGEVRTPVRVEVTVYPDKPPSSAFPVPKNLCDSCTVQQTFADGPDGYQQQVLVEPVAARLDADGWMENRRVLQRDYRTGGSAVIVAATSVPPTVDCDCAPPLDVDAINQLADVIGDPTSLFARDLPLPDPSVSPADIAWGDGRIDCGPGEDVMAAMVHLPADAGEINAAYLCEVVTRKVEGDGTWQFQVVRRIDGDLAALRTVLAPADAPRSNGSCTMNIDLGMPIWVVTEAGSHIVRVPVDGCGHAMADAVAAVGKMPTTIVNRERLRQEQSQVALVSGCSQDFKDMLRVEAADGRAPDANAERPRLDSGRAWTLCTYDVVSDGGDVVGSLTAGRKLSGAEVAKASAALAQSRPDPTCARDDHTRFATLIDGTYYWLDVALDGCAVQDHPINGGSTWWRAPDALRTLLS